MPVPKQTPVAVLLTKSWMNTLWCCLAERSADASRTRGRRARDSGTRRGDNERCGYAPYLPQRLYSLSWRCRLAPAWARDNGWRTIAWLDVAEAWPKTSTHQFTTGLCTSCPWGTVSRPLPSTRVPERYGAMRVGQDKSS